jgi:hypothetical protein
MRYASCKIIKRGAIKKGQDRNPAPFLNPISYEKPKYIRQPACRKACQDPGVKKSFLSV